jgi:secondary thiamine-phosphate synthase enzyme
MKNIIKNINLKSDDKIQILDITDKVREALAESGVRDGTVTMITQHTTSAININEQEEGLQEDMVKFLTELVPQDGDFIHNKNAMDGRFNAHSHLMALFANASETVPLVGGKLALGNWQSIFFIELDGPRPKRVVVLQIRGE